MAQVTGPYDIEAVRQKWIGKRSPIQVGRFPVEYEPIRRHCHMTGDLNPLFLDPDYAAKSKYGSVIAPPVMAFMFGGLGPWPRTQTGGGLLNEVPTPGSRRANLSVTLEFLRPVKIGDRLSGYQEIVDIIFKAVRVDPKGVWITMENRITNQDGDLVAVWRNTTLRHRSPEEVAADPELEKK